MAESLDQFELRKKDHIQLALDPRTEAVSHSGLERITLCHDALPEMDFSEVTLATTLFGHSVASPLFISSMTAGHQESVQINLTLARMASEKKWLMGVGSQRKELFSPEAASEWKAIRKEVPGVLLAGNIGLTQLIQSPISDIQKLVDSLEAVAMFVHLNPLQEVLQKEGTPQFRNGVAAIEKLCKTLSVPVIVKEVGCGMSKATLKKLAGLGVAAVDVSGLGGTHWGRVEGFRNSERDPIYQAAHVFRSWGTTSVDSLLSARELKATEKLDYALWASGGVRSGLDAAKLMALGASMVGLAKPLLEKAILGEAALRTQMEQFELELKIAMFCTGSQKVSDLTSRKVWQWLEI
jgi:isopentenyl-diphosphate delta-isomerase